MSQVNIVIIGGGVAGTITAVALMRKISKKTPLHITLVDKKDYFEYHGTIALRTLVNSQLAGSMQYEGWNKKVLQKNNHTFEILGGRRLVNIDSAAKSVLVEEHNTRTQTTLAFDYLILATGASYAQLPFIKASWNERSLAARLSNISTFSEQLKYAKHVLIVGGGSVGIEWMAEIDELYPNKRITLVHGKDRLLERAPAQANSLIHQWVEEKNKKRGEKEKIEIILNDTVVPGVTHVTAKGKPLEDVSIVLFATGPKPNTEGFENFGIPLESDGRVIVQGDLSIKGHPNIFALGDITNTKEEKSGNSARMQAKYLSSRLSKIIPNSVSKTPKDEKALKLKNYETQKFMQVISLGSKNGLMMNEQKVAMKGKIPSLMKTWIEKNLMMGLLTKPDSFVVKSSY